MVNDRYGLETELPITAKVREAVYLAFNGRCYYSGQEITREQSHVDHLIPTAKGGKDIATNYILARSDLNLRKSDIEIENIDGIKGYLRSITAPNIIKYLNECEQKKLIKKKVKNERQKTKRENELQDEDIKIYYDENQLNSDVELAEDKMVLILLDKLQDKIECDSFVERIDIDHFKFVVRVNNYKKELFYGTLSYGLEDKEVSNWLDWKTFGKIQNPFDLPNIDVNMSVKCIINSKGKLVKCKHGSNKTLFTQCLYNGRRCLVNLGNPWFINKIHNIKTVIRHDILNNMFESRKDVVNNRRSIKGKYYEVEHFVAIESYMLPA